MRAVAAKSPKAIPPLLRETRDTTSPLSSTTIHVDVADAESSPRMIPIGIAQSSRKNVVKRSSVSG